MAFFLKRCKSEKSIEPVVSNSPTENDSSLDYHGRPAPTRPRWEVVYRPIYSMLCSGGLLHLDVDKLGERTIKIRVNMNLRLKLFSLCKNNHCLWRH